MVRVSRVLLRDGVGISKTLSEILVCPLSKQPLRVCEESNSLISDAIGVAYPIVDGIPCLVPSDGKIIEADDKPKPDDNIYECYTVSVENIWAASCLKAYALGLENFMRLPILCFSFWSSWGLALNNARKEKTRTMKCLAMMKMLVSSIDILIDLLVGGWQRLVREQSYEEGEATRKEPTGISVAFARGSRRLKDELCCVCLSKMEGGEDNSTTIRALPCLHEFHKACIGRWFDGCRGKTCPVCRFSMEEEEGKAHKTEELTEEMVIWFSSFHVAGF
ncbi:hypothetical protein RJ640_011576 [Escallonia rubra]|uniref:Protein preY, mitochondrial n=1 Tax=Escallonia rubra TaxID=112253 RepID=A0AA88RUU6_9ASTE|nr:hypothetical protein RJ640_011576 [Escallonia rubra]